MVCYCPCSLFFKNCFALWLWQTNSVKSMLGHMWPMKCLLPELSIQLMVGQMSPKGLETVGHPVPSCLCRELLPSSARQVIALPWLLLPSLKVSPRWVLRVFSSLSQASIGHACDPLDSYPMDILFPSFSFHVWLAYCFPRLYPLAPPCFRLPKSRTFLYKCF